MSADHAGKGYEMLKFWKMFDTGNTDDSQDMSKPLSPVPSHRQQSDPLMTKRQQHRSSAYFAMPTTTTSNDSITQQRHHSCIFSSSPTPSTRKPESFMQQHYQSSPRPKEGSREWQVIEAAVAAAGSSSPGAVHSSSSSASSTETTTTASVPYKNAEDEVMLLRAELEKEKAALNALWKEHQAMSQTVAQLEVANKEQAAKIEQMERDKRNQVQDMDLLLRKTKATAEDARHWSFEASRYKQEMEALRVSAKNDKASWMTRAREKDRIIDTLNSRLTQMEHGIMLRQDPLSHDEPAGITHPPTSLPGGILLDHELQELTHEKERLQSLYGKIPLRGVSRHQRYQKEELERQMDKVDGRLSCLRQKIKRAML